MGHKSHNKRKSQSGAAAFDAFYEEHFGQRWQTLKSMMIAEDVYCTLCFPGCESYYMDPASVVAALCLPVAEAQQVADLCAAPGGKSLMMAANMREGAELLAGELSFERKIRLDNTLRECLPPTCRTKTTLGDSSLWCKSMGESFDAVLLDAPCSSEKHVMRSAKWLSQWSVARTRELAFRQWALASCAFRLLKSGGFLLYCTCALLTGENDAQVARLLEKFPTALVVPRDEVGGIFCQNAHLSRAKITCTEGLSLDSLFDCAEQTRFGFHILPDTAFGAGPIYFSLIQKR